MPAQLAGRGSAHARLRRVRARERLARPATRLLRARVRAPSGSRPRHARTLCAHRRGARFAHRPRDAGARRPVERGRWSRVAPCWVAGAGDGGALPARGWGAARVLESAHRRTQGRERGDRRVAGWGEEGRGTWTRRVRRSARAPAPCASHRDRGQCRRRGPDRHRVPRDALHLGRDGGQRVRLLGTDSVRLRPARHPFAAHESRSGPRRRRDRPGRGRAAPRGRAALLRASRSRRHTRRHVRWRAQVHPQLEPRCEAVAPGSAGPGGGVLAGPVGGGEAHHPMKRSTTPRRHVASGPAWTRLFVQLGVVASCNVFSPAFGPPARYGQPSALPGYEILVTSQDSLGRRIAFGLARRGFRVRTRVRGGSRPTAYLFTFTFRETEPPALTWLHVRLADTRTGAIVAGVSAPLDSLGASAADRARAIVDSLAVNPSLRRAIAPT